MCYLHSTLPVQNGRHSADGFFKCLSVNEKAWILNNISLKFVPKGLINNISALVQILAWHRLGDKPLSEPMLTQFTDACMRWVKEIPISINSSDADHDVVWKGKVTYQSLVMTRINNTMWLYKAGCGPGFCLLVELYLITWHNILWFIAHNNKNPTTQKSL